MRAITRMPIFFRLFLAFLMAAVIPGIVIAVLGTIFVNTLSTRVDAMQTANNATTTSMRALGELQRMNALLYAYHSTIYANNGAYGLNDPGMAKGAQQMEVQILDLEHSFGQDSATYQQNYLLASSPDMQNIRQSLANDADVSDEITNQQNYLKAANQQWTDYKQSQDTEMLALKANLSHSQAHKILFQANTKFAPLVANWQNIVNISQRLNADVVNSGSGQVGTISLGILIAILLTAVVVITVGFFVGRTITTPLRQLANLTKRISKGDTSARAKITSHDEIYVVANSMNNMLDNIVRLIQETQSQRDALQSQVEKLVSEVSGVGEGDLRVQAEVTADALGVLADSFNYMVEELGNLVVRVKMVAHEVENSTVTVIDRMGQLVEDGDAQLSHISEAAVEIERMADTSRRVAERAQHLYNVAIEARQDAQGGREAVGQAVEGMGRIHENVQSTASKVHLLGERSREINNIVEAISSIAHQTNRLALDAAIQAAMAGDNGKGFGAVAADIRRLAERSKEQANTITRIVRSVREDIGAVAVSMQDTERETSVGSRLTQEAGDALETIFAVIEQQAREIEGINQMSNQQLQISHSIVQIMHGVSESTQRSGATTREASQYMERLARLVEQLRSSVEAFKLQEDQDYLGTGAFPAASIEEPPDSQLSISGMFRTISATATAHPNHGGYNALPPARNGNDDAFALYPGAPNSGEWNSSPLPNNGWGELPVQSQNGGNGNWNAYPPQQFPNEQQPRYNEWGNGNGFNH